MSEFDLTKLLATWPHEAGRINARRFAGRDGKPKLQVRVELGVLQMEMEGRPDGQRPHSCDSLLDYQQGRLAQYAQESGSPDGFVLSSDECRALREEAVQYYHRYVGLFALTEYAAVVSDASHNLAILDLCRDFGATELDRTVLDQFRGPVIMMRSRSQAELAILSGRPKDALKVLDLGLRELEDAFADSGRSEEFESANEVQLLRGMRDALVPKLPSSQRVELQERLRAALDAENYELAAILRDELRLLEG